MKKLIFSFFLCGATMFPAFSQTYQELSERAVAATEQDSLSLAEKYIEQALKMEPANPHNALLFSNLGTIQRRQHRYEQALDSYTLALNIAPRAIPALMNRAALYLELGKDDLARIDYSLVLDIESDNQEALLMRAYIYMRQRNYNFAKSDYERLLKLAPQSYNGRLGLATLEQKEGKYEAALSILNAMIAEKGGEATRLTTQQYAVLYVARAGVEQDMKHVDLAMMDLEEAIKLDDYGKHGALANNFTETLPAPEANDVKSMLKDPYIFDMLTFTDQYNERDVEIGLVKHVEKFLVEMGAGFAFMGRQYHIEVSGDDYYIDILMYNAFLHRYLVIELKDTEFMPEYIGKLNFYCSAVDDILCREGDNRTIGLLLCKSKDRIKAEYALRDIQKPIGISDYELGQALPRDFRGSLPTIEEIEKELETNAQETEQRY